MKTLLKKLICMALATAVLLSVYACTGKKPQGGNPNADQTLSIYTLNRGYGVKWLEELEKAFEAENPDINVEWKAAADVEQMANTVAAGPSSNDVDLYFMLGYTAFALRDSYKNKWTGYPDGLEDLTALFNTQVPGETVTLGEKMIPSIKEMVRDSSDGTDKYFAMPWVSGVMGLIYNHDVISKALKTENYQLPRTTDELYEFAVSIKDGGATPFVYPGQLDQWSRNMAYSWWAQHEGIKNYNYFFEGKAYDEATESYVEGSRKILEQQGRLEALKVMEKLLVDGLRDATYNNYNSNDFKTLQTRFLVADEYNTEGYKFAMYPCGDWLEQESSSKYTTKNFFMMKTPVISTIVNRLPSIKATANPDETLRAVVSYVDGETATAPAGVTDEDIEEVRYARNISFSKANEHIALIPAYSKEKEAAKKFLLFMATDRAIKIFKESCKGGFSPFNYDYSSMQSSFSKYENSLVEIVRGNLISDAKKSAIFYRGNVNSMYLSDVFIDGAIGGTGTDRKTALWVFEQMLYTEQEWDQVLSVSGIN